jgi:hypothetical protein
VAAGYMQRPTQCRCTHRLPSHPGGGACVTDDCDCLEYQPVYRVNPGDDMYEPNPYGESPLQSYSIPRSNPQTYWGAGSGIYDGRGRWRPGGGRYLDPRDMGRPPYEYHPGGGFRHHGFHPGAGYNANPCHNPACARCGKQDCGCGCGGNPRLCTCLVRSNPYGESPLGDYSMPTRANWVRPCARCRKYDCGCGCYGNPERCTCREATHPYGAPIQRRRNPWELGDDWP